MKFRHLNALALALCAPALAQTVTGPIVQFNTNVGNIVVTLRPDVAPNTVANFLNYVNTGLYNNNIIHRAAANFVVQGGGWQLLNGTPTQITANAAINNECPLLSNGVAKCGLSNIRGTIAMAKLSGNPNSATDEWFFNLTNNASNLDFQNGGFTVFGQIDPSDSASLSVLDQINLLPRCDQSGAYFEFGSIPLIGNPSCTSIAASNYVVVSSITQVQSLPAITNNGILSASAFGGYVGSASPGSYVEIYGKYLSGTTRGWASSDFAGTKAPTSLDGVTVTLNGVNAFVNYVSPTQINIQVPDNIPPGPTSVVVNFQGLQSAAGTLTINATQPGLLAPASFKVGGRQYVAAVHANTNAFVSGGNIPGIPSAPAKPGETLIFYGTGFGPISNGSVAGQIASGQTTLANSFLMLIGGSQATVSYDGLAPGLVGVYQFNAIVPPLVSNGDVSVQAILNGFFPLQTLYLTVQN